MELTYLKTVIAHAAAVHGLQVSGEQVDLARLALNRLVGNGRVRDRRPWPDEITQLVDYFESNERQLIPVGRLIRFALRHEAASRLFEAGFTIEQVALVTGHRDWKMLKRYTNLRPEDLHRLAASKPQAEGAGQESAPSATNKKTILAAK
jgi:hypothetical protein